METTFNSPSTVFPPILSKLWLWYIIAVWKERTRSIEFFQLQILGTHDQGGRDVLLSYGSLDLAWRSIQGLPLKSLPACFMLFLKGRAKKARGLSKAYVETSQTSGIQNGLMTSSSVTWAALTFKNFVQILLGIKLRSVSDSKYRLKNEVLPHSINHKKFYHGWGHF